MWQTRIIAHHPFFGPVTAESWRVVFAPTDGRDGVEYSARNAWNLSSPDGYAAMGVRLDAFEGFCRSLDEHDARVQGHFRTWAASAGAFELIGVTAAMRGDLPMGIDDGELAPLSRSFGLEYRALDEDAWAFAEIPFYPPNSPPCSTRPETSLASTARSKPACEGCRRKSRGPATPRVGAIPCSGAIAWMRCAGSRPPSSTGARSPSTSA